MKWVFPIMAGPMMKEKKLLVPFDFSEVADSAVEHALVTAKVVGAEVHVLHVVSKKDSIKEAKDKSFDGKRIRYYH